MRKVNSKIEDIINQIKQLKGQNVNMEITRGRKKTVKYEGIVERIYPSIFTVRSLSDNTSSFSYSYADVLCGDVNINANEKLEQEKRG